MMLFERHLSRTQYFSLLAGGIMLADFALVRTQHVLNREPVLALGVLADCMLVVPLLYLLCHWGRARSPWRLGRLAALGATFAWLILPHDALPLLSPIKYLLTATVLGGELWLASKIAIPIWRAFRHKSRSPEPALREAIALSLGNGLVARLATLEVLIWYYALFSWRRRVPTVNEGTTFYYGTRNGSAGTLLGVAGMSLLEPPFLHLIIRIWSPLAAWVLTALSIYGFFCLLGEYRATRLRPVTLDADNLHIRCGLALGGPDVSVPRNLIASISAHRGMVNKRDAGVLLSVGILAEANLCVTLREPIRVTNHLGRDKLISRIYLSLDEPLALITALSHS